MIDTSDMLFAHRVFRRELSDAPELIGGVASGDTNRSALIADHLGHMVAALHHHHAAEDELLWPSLHARIPTFGLEIQQMEDDHAAIAELVESVETVRTPWGKSADSTLTPLPVSSRSIRRSYSRLRARRPIKWTTNVSPPRT
jgi:hemerythrin-like domain-containing protein